MTFVLLTNSSSPHSRIDSRHPGCFCDDGFLGSRCEIAAASASYTTLEESVLYQVNGEENGAHDDDDDDDDSTKPEVIDIDGPANDDLFDDDDDDDGE